jgi:acyl carrier protein
MLSMLDLIKNALYEECGVDPEDVLPTVDLLKDLDIDSLDMLNAAFRIEKDCGVKLPLQAWLSTAEMNASETGPFVVTELISYLEMHLAIG